MTETIIYSGCTIECESDSDGNWPTFRLRGAQTLGQALAFDEADLNVLLAMASRRVAARWFCNLSATCRDASMDPKMPVATLSGWLATSNTAAAYALLLWLLSIVEAP